MRILKNFYLFFIFISLNLQLSAQVDSLFNAYNIPYKNKNVKSWDTLAIKEIMTFCSKNQGYQTKLADSVISIIIKNEDKIANHKVRVRLIPKAKITKANCQLLLGNYTVAEKYFKEVILEKDAEIVDRIKAESNMGITCYYKGEYSQSLEYYLSSIEKSKKHNIPTVNPLLNICLIYQILSNTEKQLYYSKLALKESVKRKDTTGIVYSYNSIGIAYKTLGELDKAIENFEKAIEISKKVNEYVTMSDANINLGNIYLSLGKYDEAIGCYKKSLDISKKLDRNLFLYYLSLARGYAALNDLRKAKLYNDSTKLYFDGSQRNVEIADFYKMQGLVFYKLGKYKGAYDFLELSAKYGDSVINEKNTNEINNLQQEYALRSSKLEDSLKFALKEKGIRNKNALLTAKKNAQLELQKGVIIFSIAFALLLLGTIFYVFKMYKKKKEANEIIAQQKNLAEFQKAEISKKNSELTDSINYAKNLQDALLPSQSFLSEVFQNSGLVYLPKDIVSGDFYWIFQKDEYKYIAVADCTGHGVPGAMMSLIGITGLERCVKENLLTEPAEILDQLNVLVEKTFSAQNYDINDGMDISLIKINTKTRKVSFAGAYNPLWVFSDENCDELNLHQSTVENTFLYTFNANKQPIGRFRDRVPFTQHDFTLPEKAKVVLLTDGYADQFGGEGGKKLKYQIFRKIIAENLNESSLDIAKILKAKFQTWKKDYEQVDDVTVVVLEV